MPLRLSYCCFFPKLLLHPYLFIARDQILRVKAVESSTASSIPFLLVGNKSDLESNRQVLELNLSCYHIICINFNHTTRK